MKYFKTTLEALLYFFIVILSQKIAKFGYALILLLFVDTNGTEEALEAIYQTQTLPILIGWVIAMGLIGLVFGYIKQNPLRTLNNPSGFQNVLLAIVIGLGLMLITNSVVNALGESSMMEPLFEKLTFISEGSLLWTLLIVGIVTPIFEEIVFRGLIMGKLMGGGSLGFAVLLQGLLFSISHFNVVQGISVFLLGIITGLSVLKTKSLKIGILIHMVFNITNLYLEAMDRHYYDIGQLAVLLILGLVLTYFGVEKLESKTPRTVV